MSTYRSQKYMENFEAQTKLKNPHSFEIKKTIKQAPFKEDAARSFFDMWCKANDSIVPQIASRQYWEDHIENQGLLSKNPDETQTLFIPNDIKLWEMVDVIETVDKDTFINKPELREKKKQELLNLGKMFRNSGIYIAQRIDSIKEGRPLAEELTKELFSYGNALIIGHMGREADEIPIEKIALNPITPEETEQADQWLAGQNLYKSRMEKVKRKLDAHPPENADQIVENMRRSTLNQFFKTAEKAFSLRDKNPNNLILTSHKFLKNIDRKIQANIETPKKELYDSLFRRGLEGLINEIHNPKLRIIAIRCLRLNLLIPAHTREAILTDSLGLDSLKQQLQEIKRNGNLHDISEKELEITNRIQQRLFNYEFKNNTSNPSEMIASRQMNCLGKTMLAGKLLKEAGISYLPVNVPNHAIVFVITSDKRVFWEDVTQPWLSGELKDEDIQGKSPDGKNLTTADIVDFSKNPKNGILFFGLSSQKQREKMPWVKRNAYMKYVRLLPPETGEKLMLINNTIYDLLKHKHYKEAIGALNLARLEGSFNSALYGIDTAQFGHQLRNAGRYQDAIKFYEQAIELYPDGDAYNGLGNAFLLTEKYRKAIEAYQRAISLDSKFAHPHNGLANTFVQLDRLEDAAREYEIFISLADPKEDSHLIRAAQRQLEEFKKSKDKTK